MLLQQLRCARAQVSAFVRTDAQNVVGSAVRSNATGARSNITALHSWNRGARLHAEASQASAGMQLRWNRPMCATAVTAFERNVGA
jgi:hypothetical protein